MKPVIAISMGDYNGIGPEVILKSLADIDISESTPLVIGHKDIFDYYSGSLSGDNNYRLIKSTKEIKDDNSVYIINCLNKRNYNVSPGNLTRESGRSSMLAVTFGANLCMKRKADALVTAPISKEAIAKAGYKYMGHTDFLTDLSGADDTLMLMVAGSLRIGLLTSHIPLTDVSRHITEEYLIHIIRLFHKVLRIDFGIEIPKIAVLGVNPHSGDGGVIGQEEIKVVIPALKKTRQNALITDGPVSADGFFGNKQYERYDGILAMYHDQGLIPFKTLSFGSGVNFTAGLPFIRTSPDHGTAFEIAGRGIASPESFKAAYRLAVELVYRKRDRKGK